MIVTLNNTIQNTPLFSDTSNTHTHTHINVSSHRRGYWAWHPLKTSVHKSVRTADNTTCHWQRSSAISILPRLWPIHLLLCLHLFKFCDKLSELRPNYEKWEGWSMRYMKTWRFWWRHLTRIDHFEDLSVHGRIILKRILKKWDGKVFEQVWSCCEQHAGNFVTGRGSVSFSMINALWN